MNSFKLKKIFYLIDGSPLRPLLYFPYLLASKVTSFVIRGNNVKVWFRNSYYLQSLVVGVSDLDISVQFEKPPANDDLNRLNSKYRFLKKIFPFLGEINIYVESDSDIFPLFNPFELNRDPILKEYSRINERVSDYQKLAFIVRMFEPDRENLLRCPELRVKKWSSHFLSIGRIIPSQRVLNDVIHYISTTLSSESQKYEQALYSFVEKGSFDFASSREEILLFPHRWAVWVNVNGGLEEGLKSLCLSEDEKIVIQEMIRWELMGLYTQFYLLDKSSNLMFYLELLKELNNLISDSKNDELNILVDRLIHR